MSSSTADRPRLRSSTWGSLQTLTRALRESLRLRKLRKQKRLKNEANNEQMRRRSKSVGNAYIDDEISEVGISVAVASDIGPVLNQAKQREARMAAIMPKRRQSKSVDDVEMAEIKRSIEKEREKMLKLTPNRTNGQPRRRSKDDHDLPSNTSKIKDSHYYVTEQKGFRKRFGRLFGSLRNRTHIQLPPSSPTPSSASEGETADGKSNVKTNEELIITSANEEQNNETNNEVFNCEETTVKDRE